MKRAYPDPERCGQCGMRGRVVESKPRIGFRWRRHKCLRCGSRWSSYQSLINVAPVIARRRRGTPAPKPAAPAPVSPPAPLPAATRPVVEPMASPARRTSRSRYLGVS